MKAAGGSKADVGAAKSSTSGAGGGAAGGGGSGGAAARGSADLGGTSKSSTSATGGGGATKDLSGTAKSSTAGTAAKGGDKKDIGPGWSHAPMQRVDWVEKKTKDGATVLAPKHRIFYSHYGPGTEHGKPFDRDVLLGGGVSPKARSPFGLHMQTARNDRSLLRAYNDPPSGRIAYNKNGRQIEGLSHTTKIGSKHMQDLRPDHPQVLARSRSLPGQQHFSEARCGKFYELRDPTPWLHNDPYTTSNDGYGKFYARGLETPAEDAA